ncbi:MAG: SusC/RagA family TonB-linked outer membrane protein [Prolixibacteraceae bacterium]|nr:SusC/RagA family TonB-linked outer membrane protein [Prolixibacteraceae bacterium]
MKNNIFLTGLLLLVISFSGTVFAQNSVILTGTVLDKTTREALSFVNVVEIDKNGRFVSGTVTDLNGNYVIKVRDVNNSIQVSFIGYTKTSFSLQGRTNIDVELESESQSLGEVSVTAEVVGNDGITKVRDRGTAVSRMEFKDMESMSTTTVEEMMQGRMGNVDITAVSGDPGAGINIRIRGTSSLNARNNPLIVINGIPYDAEFDENFDLASADIEKFGSLIDVSPEDIESIEVLKDAASTAAWGSKASNGVLMIKTKRGVKSKPIFEYTFKSTVGKEPDPIPMLDGAGYARLIREAHYNDVRNAGFTGEEEISFDRIDLANRDKELNNYNKNTNWVDEITQIAFTQQHDFSVRGGGEKSRYNLSTGFTDEGGTTIGNRLKKINLRSSLDYDLSTKLQFRTDIMYTRYDQDMNFDVGEGEFERNNKMVRQVAYRKMPNLSVFERDTNDVSYGEYFTPTSTIQGTARDLYNPVAFVNLSKQNRLKDNARALFSIRYNIMPSLIFNSTVTLDIFDEKISKFLPFKAIGYDYNNDITNKGINEFNKKSSIYTINQLIYTPNWGPDHDFGAMVQFDTEETVSRWFKTETSQSASPNIQEPVGDKHLVYFGSNFSKYRSLGVFSTVSYKFKDKYIMMIGAKYEGNSKFSPESRWGLFPTTSLAWRISEEPFLKWIKPINDLKIRGSWGQSGNSPRSNYLYFNTYSAGSDISYLDLQGVKPNGVELTSLKWETIDQLNLGFSFMGFNNRMNIEFDVYSKRTLDLYLENSGIPSSTGFSSINQNFGEMENRGIEFMIDYAVIKRKDLEFSMNFNASRNENMVIELPDNYSREYGNMLENGNYKISIQPGQPMGGFYGYHYDGVYSTEADTYVKDVNGNVVYAADGVTPLVMIHGGTSGYVFEAGDAKYRDINHDGKIDELDVDYLGDLNPSIMGGGGFRLKYKNLVLNSFFHYKLGQEIINQTRMDTEKMHNHDNQSMAVNWRWRREGDITHIPRALYNKGYNWMGSDRFVEDGSFIRFKTLSLSYIFGKNACDKLNIKGLKVYSTAYNLYTWTNYSGQDPDVSPPSRPDRLPKDYSKTPPSRRIMFGVNVTF